LRGYGKKVLIIKILKYVTISNKKAMRSKTIDDFASGGVHTSNPWKIEIISIKGVTGYSHCIADTQMELW